MNANYKRLVAAAVKARKNSYSPYSKFKVGAAVLTARGTIYTGTNVENASYGLTICAERAAIACAVAAGERRIAAIAVVADTPDPVRPCGACLQVIAEFAPQADIVMATTKGRTAVATAEELLPGSFRMK